MIPTSLNIGGHRVEVVQTRMGNELCGRSEPTRGRILVNEELLESDKMATLLHEILEQINSNFDLQMGHTFLSTIGEALFQVLVDNDLCFGEDGMQTGHQEFIDPSVVPIGEQGFDFLPGIQFTSSDDQVAMRNGWVKLQIVDGRVVLALEATPTVRASTHVLTAEERADAIAKVAAKAQPLTDCGPMRGLEGQATPDVTAEKVNKTLRSLETKRGLDQVVLTKSEFNWLLCRAAELESEKCE